VPTEDYSNTQNFEVIEQIADKGVNSLKQPANRKKMIIGGISGVIVLILLLTLVVVTSGQRPNTKPTPTPQPTATPTPFVETIASPSAYATDSAVLKIESDIKDIEDQLQNVDLKDNNLLPPALNLNINFKPN
jgi:hypothetical protein